MSEKKDNNKSRKRMRRILTEKLAIADSFRKETTTKGDWIFTAIIIIILSLFSSFYILVLANTDALKAFIEAEATVLGFFGIIAVYMLTSIDSRIDRLESEKHEYEAKLEFAVTGSPSDAKPTPSSLQLWTSKVSNLEGRLDRIQNKKETLAYEASIIGTGLIVSLIADVALLGLQSMYVNALTKFSSPLKVLVSLAAATPTMLFFISTWYIFSLLRRMGKKPKSN
jgi:hypothetical protein